MLKKLLIWIFSLGVILSSFNFVFLNSVFAVPTEKADFLLIPESDKYSKDWVNRMEAIMNSWWHVWDEYNNQSYDIWWEKVKKADSLWLQLSTWIMNWDTIIDYVVYVLKFLSQISLLIGAVMFIYYWYKYVTYSFGWQPSSKDIKNAIIWILIVIFSYAFMKILLNMFIF